VLVAETPSRRGNAPLTTTVLHCHEHFWLDFEEGEVAISVDLTAWKQAVARLRFNCGNDSESIEPEC